MQQSADSSMTERQDNIWGTHLCASTCDYLHDSYFIFITHHGFGESPGQPFALTPQVCTESTDYFSQNMDFNDNNSGQ